MFFVDKFQYAHVLHKIEFLESQVYILQDREKEHLARIKDLESLNLIPILDFSYSSASFRCGILPEFKCINLRKVVEKILEHLNLSLEYTSATEESVQLKKGEKKNVK
jgi:hypothetical protein